MNISLFLLANVLWYDYIIIVFRIFIFLNARLVILTHYLWIISKARISYWKILSGTASSSLIFYTCALVSKLLWWCTEEKKHEQNESKQPVTFRKVDEQRELLVPARDFTNFSTVYVSISDAGPSENSVKTPFRRLWLEAAEELGVCNKGQVGRDAGQGDQPLRLCVQSNFTKLVKKAFAPWVQPEKCNF